MPKWKTILKGIVLISILLLLIALLENGFLGVGLFIFLFIGYIIASKWKQFKDVMQIIETKIWGKPLTQHTKKELKENKIYFTWGKTKKQKASIEFIIMLLVILLLSIIALLYNLVMGVFK